MHVVQQPYRDLYHKLLSYDGGALFSDVVAPWLASVKVEKTWLRDVARRASPGNELAQEDSWRLYALSRIIDLLSIGATRPESGSWRIAPLTRGQFTEAMEELGLAAVSAPSFHPFFHEIDTVDEAQDSNAPAEIREEVLPGYRIGKLLACRARCRIVVGREQMKKEVADASVLYWAFARNNRPTADLSVGWGSNSQWRTSFRLDYEVDGTYYFNHGGERAPTNGDETLETDEILELLRHRCFVRCAKDGSDLWPYAWCAIERPNQPLQLTPHSSYARAGRS